MQQSEFADHCEALHRKHFAGRAQMNPTWPFIQKNVQSYYGKAVEYDSGWQVKIAWVTLSLPDWVRDYVICHELAHCVDDTRAYGAMHTSEFWALLRAAYPRTDEAERWLKRQDRRRPSVDGPNGDMRRKYPVGVRVLYADSEGNEYTGHVKRHSRRTISLSIDGSGGWWRFGWGIIDKAIIEIL